MHNTAHVDRFVLDNMPPEKNLPDFIFETPELQFPDRLNAAVALLDKAVVEGAGDLIALIGEDIRWTYRDLQMKVNQLAQLLSEDMGLVPGNRVLLRGANTPWFAVSWLAVWKAGGIAVGTMPLLRAKELKQFIHKAHISHALCEKTLSEELNLVRSECPELTQVIFFGDDAFAEKLSSKSTMFEAVDTAAEDPALIAFTSGTTGIPKGCIHLHRDVMAMCAVVAGYWLKPSANDVFIGTPPLAFTFGLGGLLCFPLWAKASTVLLEKLTPPVLLKAIEQYGATICFTSPTGYRQMINIVAQYDLQSLKKCVSAGEPLPLDTRKKWREATGIQIHDGIGGTELIHIYIASDPETYHEGALGKILPGYQGIIVDEEMNPVAVGETGRLALKGPTGCRYLADDRQEDTVEGGWNITGDTYHQDSEGYFYFHARIDDIIVTSGYNVASPEVESVLLEHPAVSECGVIGVPDPDRGQIIKAFIVLNPGYVADETMVKDIQDFVKRNAAPYKYPRAIKFITALPRTETGKIQRFKFKQMS